LEIVEKQQLEIKEAELERLTNTEPDEVNLQMKRACLRSKTDILSQAGLPYKRA